MPGLRSGLAVTGLGLTALIINPDGAFTLIKLNVAELFGISGAIAAFTP